MSSARERSIIRIGTRGSQLALWQAEHVRAELTRLRPDLAIELVKIVSSGDVVLDRPLHQIGGVGIFTKEVQDAVLANAADLAVHSLKDLPTQSHPSLVLAATPPRGPVHDVLLSPRHQTLDNLPNGAKVATSSLRRRAQLLKRRPDLNVVDIRGNVETRVRKIDEQQLDGLILAFAGLDRLGMSSHVTQKFTASEMVPAVGQGALGIECRADDTFVRDLLAGLDDASTRAAVLAEREFLRVLQGGCQVPIGAHATIHDGTLHLHGIVLDRDGKRSFDGSIRGPADLAENLGHQLAQQLVQRGARELLDRN